MIKMFKLTLLLFAATVIVPSCSPEIKESREYTEIELLKMTS